MPTPDLRKLQGLLDRKPKGWEKLPTYANGTIVTGKLTDNGGSQSLQPGSVETPGLPIEVLRELMLAATDCYPAPYSSHCQEPITSGTMTPFLLREDLELEVRLQLKSLAMKFTLSRVCKAWRAFAAEFLFNTIVLYDLRQIERLLYALDADKSRRGGVEGPGSWAGSVRRLWVAETLGTQQVPPSTTVTLQELFQRCPNVLAFRNFGRYANDRPMYRDSVDATATSRAIMLIASGDQLHSMSSNGLLEINLDTSESSWQDILGDKITFPLVKALKIRCQRFFGEGRDELGKGVTFPNLEYLHLSGFRSFQQAELFTMPSLKRVAFNSNQLDLFTAHDTERRSRVVISFFEVHGEGLEELSITAPLLWKLDLDNLCPNLTTLHAGALVRVEGKPQLDFSRVSHGTARQVGFCGLDFEEWIEQEDPDAFFGSTLSSYPNVRVIQDLSWNSNTLKSGAAFCWSQAMPLRRRNPFWKKTLELMTERNVMLL